MMQFCKRGIAALSCTAMLASPVSAFAFDMPSQIFHSLMSDTSPWKTDVVVRAHATPSSSLSTDLWMTMWISAKVQRAGGELTYESFINGAATVNMTTDVVMGDGKLRVKGEIRMRDKTAYLRVTGIEGSYEDFLTKAGITINQKKWLAIPLSMDEVVSELPMQFNEIITAAIEEGAALWDNSYNLTQAPLSSGTRYTLALKQDSLLKETACENFSVTCEVSAEMKVDFDKANNALSSTASVKVKDTDMEISYDVTMQKLSGNLSVQKPADTMTLEEVMEQYGSNFNIFGVPEEYCVGACDISQPHGRNMQRNQDLENFGYLFQYSPAETREIFSEKPMEICQFGQSCRGVSIDSVLGEYDVVYVDPSAPEGYAGTRYFGQLIDGGQSLRLTAPDTEEGAKTVENIIYFYDIPTVYPDESDDSSYDEPAATRTTNDRVSRRTLQQQERDRQSSRSGDNSIRSLLTNAHPLTIGSAQAPVIVAEFSDYQCPFCTRYFSQYFPSIKTKYIDTNQVRFMEFHFPLSFHPQAQDAAEAVECARDTSDEVALTLHNAIFAADLSSNDVTDADIIAMAKAAGADITQCLTNHTKADLVAAQAELGTSLGVTGTPSFVIIDQSGNAQLIQGASSAVEEYLDELLK